MERILSISLTKITFEEIIQILEIRTFDPDWFNVRPLLSREKFSSIEHLWRARYGVFDLDNIKVGELKLKDLPNATIITFYCTDNKYRQAFVEYIQSTIGEIKIADYNILGFQEFGEDTIILGIDKKQDITNKEGNLENSMEGKSNSDTTDSPAVPSEEISTQSIKPWEQIKEEDGDKEMVRLLHEGLSAGEIAKKMCFEKRTVYNRLSELRQKYTCKIVPYIQKWRKCED